MEKESNFYLYPKDINKHIDDIKRLTLDTIVEKEIRLYGTIKIISLAYPYYFITAIPEYNFNRDFFTSGLTILGNGSTVSFIVRKKNNQYFADNIFLAVKQRNT